MEHWQLGDSVTMDGPEGPMRQLAFKWFTETQAPGILHEGNFPGWFQGFIARRDAEDRLRDKNLGSFLIRLSDKAMGYILSYKGRDRCRHFVINQNNAGELVVSGDTETHNSLIDLIEYYKVSPIEPFGEYLTSSWCESSQSELYDVVQFHQKQKPGVSVQAAKTFWDQWSDRPAVRPPALPPKMARKLSVFSSLDKTPVPQALPPVTKQSSADDRTPLHGQILYSELEIKRNDKPHSGLTSKGSLKMYTVSHTDEEPYSLSWSFSKPQEANHPTGKPTPNSSAVTPDFGLLDYRCKSLPVLEDGTGPQCCFRQNSASSTPPKLSPNPTKKTTCHTVSLVDQRDHFREPSTPGFPSSSSSSSLDQMYNSSLYQLAGGAQWEPQGRGQSHGGTAQASVPALQQEEELYAQVPHEPDSSHMVANKIYEQIPDQASQVGVSSSDRHGNTYETLEDMKQKGVKKNDIWRRLFPDHKRN